MICYFCKESTETIEFTIDAFLEKTNQVCKYCYFKYVEVEE